MRPVQEVKDKLKEAEKEAKGKTGIEQERVVSAIIALRWVLRN